MRVEDREGSTLGGKREKAAGWGQPLWNKTSKPMLHKTFQ